LGTDMWKGTDASDPRKVFAQEVFATVSARLPNFSQNGSVEDSVNGGFWNRIRRRKNEQEKSDQA